jgi:transketolase
MTVLDWEKMGLPTNRSNTWQHYAPFRTWLSFALLMQTKYARPGRSQLPAVNGPTLMTLSRQNTPTIDRTTFAPASGLQRGAYVLADMGPGAPQLILMSTGTEVSLIVDAGYRLLSQGINVRLVSFPSPGNYLPSKMRLIRNSVLSPDIKARLAVEAGISQGWERWVGSRGRIIAVNTYGASAPFKVLYEQYGLTTENIVNQAKQMLGLASIM